MPDIEAIEVLTQAKERLFEHGWGQWSYSTRKRNGDTESMCLEEALRGEHDTFCWPWDNAAVQRAAKYVIAAASDVCCRHVFQWNDTPGRTANEVFAVVDDAIHLAKEASLVPGV